MFGPWHDLMALPEATFVADARNILARWSRLSGTKPGRLNPMVAEALAQRQLKTRADAPGPTES